MAAIDESLQRMYRVSDQTFGAIPPAISRMMGPSNPVAWLSRSTRLTDGGKIPAANTFGVGSDTNVRNLGLEAIRPTLYSSALSVVPLTMHIEARGWDLI